MIWTPLLNEKEIPRYRAKLDEIADFIAARNTAPTADSPGKKDGGPGLMDGECGIALFCFYYSRLTNNEKFFDIGHESLNRAFESVNAGFRRHGFSAGLAGVGWTLEHLGQQNFLETSTNELLAELDEFMMEALAQDLAFAQFDYLHGALGAGLYFLARAQSGGPGAEQALEQIVDALARHAHVDHDGAARWQTIRDYRNGARAVGVSLSHGVASIVAFLASLLERRIAPETVRILLLGGARFLLNQRLTDPEFHSIFPVWSLEAEPAHNSRLAWCYGDPGIAISLLRASRVLDNSDLRQHALEILRHSTQRRTPEVTGVTDAGLCHGTCGLAHIFHRVNCEEPDPLFRDAAAFWFNETLAMARFPDGAAGFKARYGDEFGGWIPLADLLEGAAGVGLALISLISAIEPAWDQCLLLD